jgi:hypothetical protein
MSLLPAVRVAVAVLAVALVAGCGGGSGGPAADPTPSHLTPSPSPRVPELPLGKSDLALDPGVYGSPAGFSPALEITVPEGWSSVHRGSDGFDFGMPDPERDAPLLAVVLLRPAADTAAAAIEEVRAAATGRVRTVDGMIGSIPAVGLDVRGGTGELVSSAGLGIALDAAPGQRVRVLAADVGGVPLVEVVLVPDARRWGELLPVAVALTRGIALAEGS